MLLLYLDTMLLLYLDTMLTNSVKNSYFLDAHMFEEFNLYFLTIFKLFC